MSDRAANGRRMLVALGAVGIAVGVVVVAAPGQPADPLDEADLGPVPAEARVIEVAGSDVCVAVWDERQADGGSEPWYGVSLDGRTVQRVAPADYAINLAGLSFDPLAAPGSAEALPTLAAELTVPVSLKTQAPPLTRHGSQCDPDASAGSRGESRVKSLPDRRLFIVQFHTQSLSVYRERIEELGGTIHRYLPAQAHLVEMDAATRDAVAALPFVRYVGPYHPAFKLEPTVREQLIGGDSAIRPALDGAQPCQGNPQSAIRYNVMVCERGPRQKEIVAEQIEELGGTIDSLPPSGFRLEATLTPEQLLAIVRMDEVLFVDRWSEPVTCMDVARQIGGANLVETVAGYTGAGVRAEVFDQGFDPSHQDFAAIPPLLHGPQGPMDDHGTATYGIVFGDGTGNADARGLLPDAQGIMADVDAITDRYAHTAELLAGPYLAVFQSVSWGTHSFPEAYGAIAAELDDILFLNDITVLHAMGNMGDGVFPPAQQAIAKNSVGVGGAYHYDTLSKSDDCWCGGSSSGPSVGPAPDGRIKPDLTHFYDAVLTTAPGDAYVTDFGGTSAATPITAGHFGLFFQMWNDELFGNTVPNPGGTVFENRPHAATAKAMLINAASQYPFSGTSHDLTRMHQGWGMADVRRLYALQDRFAVIVDESDVLTELGNAQYPVVVDPNQAALRATLVYTDPAGTPNVNPNRVNDLTLRVTSPSAVVYWGNNGLLAGNWSTSGGGANTIDTVENVFVQDPEPGPWTVEIIASEINGDGHPETPGVDDADYGLVVSIEPPPVVGDLDADWDCDLDDFALLAACMNGPGNPPSCGLVAESDLDGDGDCDLHDFAVFTAAAGPPAGACCLDDGGCLDGVTADTCTGQGGVYQGDGTTCATADCPDPFCYSNTGPPTFITPPGPGLMLADDLTLDGAGPHDLTGLELQVYATTGGAFDVTAALWTDCPGNGGSVIPGTTFTWTGIPADATFWVLSVDSIDPPVTIPDTVWMVATFTDPDANWVLGEQAEIGFTDEVVGKNVPPWGCSMTFGGIAYPGLWANLRCGDGGGKSRRDGGPRLTITPVDAPAALRVIEAE